MLSHFIFKFLNWRFAPLPQDTSFPPEVGDCVWKPCRFELSLSKASGGLFVTGSTTDDRAGGSKGELAKNIRHLNMSTAFA